MNRSCLLIAVGLLLLAGCAGHNESPKCDPFFGRTTIPPPSTGAAGCRSADPYYPPLPGVQPSAQPQPGCPPGSAVSPANPSTNWAPRAGSPNTNTPSGSTPYGSGPGALGPRPPSTAPPSTVTPPGSRYGAPPSGAPANTGPTSTAPPYSPPTPSPAPSSSAPANPSASASPGSRYYNSPSAGTVGYRGVSLQGARSSVAQPTSPTGGNPSGTWDDRAPRPTDATGDGGAAAQKPTVRTLQPRGGGDPPSRPAVEIGDLPKDP
jgi:hypothetical protein